MPSHRHQCPTCKRMFACSAEVQDNPDGHPVRLCAAEDGGHGYPLIKPRCEECRDDAEADE